mmetsp:Transcript_15234/g.23122  ORF Transcript_15234/g.23122 Transcript_15234/m.23122 type:complete len:561 (+) Transcript_15234:107-1789(+)|eukprot:CAMPEP_0202694340 /NCGR_PEP_ID=MMETSP1385-20130828/8221_1 /ASSEMBLY_ACC=CAM_ASM_000861 /TAXON_ID=933848 /ORGANISM="Elphidium margaritaceum" /LENGTH=560 /DNA_ID=CAMNT_0049350159 /DNA_START=66 /DNA_END=1748 /DNA_ORIENTATION=+
MPREILHISVGQCGNQIGEVFWHRMLEEHNLTNEGLFNFGANLKYEDYFKLDKIDVYFNECEQRDKFVPRSVLIDLEPGVIDKIRHSNIGPLFHPDFIITQASGAGNNWAKGHYTYGAEIIDDTMDVIRRNVEMCDQLQGFQLSHSVGGGTGSGFGTLVLEKLKDDYYDRINVTWSIYPTLKVSDVVVEPYNAILSLAHILNDSDCTFVADNEALFNISHNVLRQKNPTFADINWLLSLVMGGCTASLRFPGLLNCDLRKMSTNLIPFPRLHFFTSAYSPLLQRGASYRHTNWSLDRISDNVWSESNRLTSIRNEEKAGGGKFLAASVMYRGRDLSSAEIDSITQQRLDKHSGGFVSWIPHNVKTSIITLKPSSVDVTATMVGNVTSVKDCFERIWLSFNKLFKRKAFLHWYRGEGMHELEFIDNETQIKELIEEYLEKQNAVVDLNALYGSEDEDEEEEEYESEESMVQMKTTASKIRAVAASRHVEDKYAADADDDDDEKTNAYAGKNLPTLDVTQSPRYDLVNENELIDAYEYDDDADGDAQYDEELDEDEAQYQWQ